VQVGPIVFIIRSVLVQVYVYHVAIVKNCLHLNLSPLRGVVEISAANHRSIVFGQCDDKHHLLTALLVLLRIRYSDAICSACTGNAFDDPFTRAHQGRRKTGEGKPRFG